MSIDIFTQIRQAEQAKKRALAALHVELGYSTPQALAEAIVEASKLSSTKTSAAKPAASSAAAKTSSAKASKAGRGHRVPPELKSQIEAALKAGEAGNSLTTKFGVSYGVVHSIKERLGLVAKASPGRKPNKKKN